MAELQECITDDSWKQSLQSEIITALTESGQTQNHALEQVGYYYQCCAPAFLYKYYRDQPLNLNSVMSNKMWYSAPRNFNDAFDCDIAIDEQAIFNNLLPAISGGKTIRKGSPAWIQLKSNLHNYAFREYLCGSKKLHGDYLSKRSTGFFTYVVTLCK